MAKSTLVPEDLLYTKDHEWVRLDGEMAATGLTDHAQAALGDITYVELPPAGKQVKQFDELAAVESAKAASDLYAPVSGVVSEVNDTLEEAPEKVNNDPYGEGWVCKMSGVNPTELDNLLTAEQYQALLRSEEE